MRENAPNVAHWVTRLWRTRPEDLEGVASIDGVSGDLQFFFDLAANDYLPYLEANSAAFVAGKTNTTYTVQGVQWTVPTAPYRVQCFNVLKKKFAMLDDTAKTQIANLLDAPSIGLLQGSIVPMEETENRTGLRDRLWK